MLWLNNTQVTDLTPLGGITGLQRLHLDNTQIADLAPLAGITGLHRLWLDNTQVTDLAPLGGLTGLRTLLLNNTQIFDLRPTIENSGLIPDEDSPGISGLHFQNTPFASASAEQTRLSEIEGDVERTRDTLSYLKTLPPWPAPLVFERGELVRPEPKLPQPQSAPLEVAFVEGVLRSVTPANDLEAAEDKRAEQGWGALRDYADDLADQKDRINNIMPRLAKAMTRVEHALGDSFETCNAIATGVHGTRVIRLSEAAAENLMDEDAGDIIAYAAALALYLERFPAWQAYLRDAEAQRDDAPSIVALLPILAELTEGLRTSPIVDGSVIANLNDQQEAVSETPSDPLTSQGLIRSYSNVLALLAANALKWVRKEVSDIGSIAWKKTKGTLAGVIVAVGIGAAGIGAAAVLEYNTAILTKLAAEQPALFGWLDAVLKTLPR